MSKQTGVQAQGQCVYTGSTLNNTQKLPLHVSRRSYLAISADSDTIKRDFTRELFFFKTYSTKKGLARGFIDTVGTKSQI